MSQQEPENSDLSSSESGLRNDFVREVIDAVEEDRISSLRVLLLDLEPQDISELLNQLSSYQRTILVETLGDGFDENILPYLESDARADVVEALGIEKTAEAIQELDSDDALYVFEELEEDQQQEVLDTVDEDVRDELKEALTYPDSSAGRLMRRNFVAIPEFWTVGDTIDHLRAHPEMPEDYYALFITDPKYHLVGELLLARLMKATRDITIRDIMNTDMHTISTHKDQEEVAYIFRKYGMVEAPVINDQGRLVGTITVDDVVDVMQEEEEEDVMLSVGLSRQDLYAGISRTVSRRFPWLFVNLLTAIAASLVIDQFQDVIGKLVLLAVLMPIIASMGGNAGIQSATVMVRAMAMRRISPGRAWGIILKEVIIGMLNGVGIAVITSLSIYILYGDSTIALVFGAATIITMGVAGLGGSGLPVLLKRLGFDPAISSGIFLTMLTDMVGFFSFLGLAALILMK